MKSSQQWLAYYRQNAKELVDIPWQIGADMTPEETSAVQQSLREFQAGESSEGHHLIANSREYAKISGDDDYLATIQLFVAEEQRHARDLARFLAVNGISLVRTTFTDRVFRGLRNLLSSLELSIAVLITAEIIAKVYYTSLREATRSVVLRSLCDQILYDELSHVAFQSDQLLRLRFNRGSFATLLTYGAQRFLFFGTVLIVWALHWRVMTRAKNGFTTWWRSCWAEFEMAMPRKAPSPF